MPEAGITTWERLGTVVREARTSRGLTQQQLAEAAGVSRAWLVRVEAGHRRAEIDQLLKVLGALDLTLAVKERQHSEGAAAVLAALARHDRRSR